MLYVNHTETQGDEQEEDEMEIHPQFIKKGNQGMPLV